MWILQPVLGEKWLKVRINYWIVETLKTKGITETLKPTEKGVI